VDRKSLEEQHAKVLGYELAADFQANHRNFREQELADKEKRSAERQP
jgi:hypothetical protein